MVTYYLNYFIIFQMNEMVEECMEDMNDDADIDNEKEVDDIINSMEEKLYP